MNRYELVTIIGHAEVERLESEDCHIRNCVDAPGGAESVAQIRIDMDGRILIAEAVHRLFEYRGSTGWWVDHYNIDGVSDANKFRRIIEP